MLVEDEAVLDTEFKMVGLETLVYIVDHVSLCAVL